MKVRYVLDKADKLLPYAAQHMQSYRNLLQVSLNHRFYLFILLFPPIAHLFNLPIFSSILIFLLLIIFIVLLLLILVLF